MECFSKISNLHLFNIHKFFVYVIVLFSAALMPHMTPGFSFRRFIFLTCFENLAVKQRLYIRLCVCVLWLKQSFAFSFTFPLRLQTESAQRVQIEIQISFSLLKQEKRQVSLSCPHMCHLSRVFSVKNQLNDLFTDARSRYYSVESRQYKSLEISSIHKMNLNMTVWQNIEIFTHLVTVRCFVVFLYGINAYFPVYKPMVRRVPQGI